MRTIRMQPDTLYSAHTTCSVAIHNLRACEFKLQTKAMQPTQAILIPERRAAQTGLEPTTHTACQAGAPQLSHRGSPTVGPVACTGSMYCLLPECVLHFTASDVYFPNNTHIHYEYQPLCT